MFHILKKVIRERKVSKLGMSTSSQLGNHLCSHICPGGGMRNFWSVLELTMLATMAVNLSYNAWWVVCCWNRFNINHGILIELLFVVFSFSIFTKVSVMSLCGICQKESKNNSGRKITCFLVCSVLENSMLKQCCHDLISYSIGWIWRTYHEISQLRAFNYRLPTHPTLG